MRCKEARLTRHGGVSFPEENIEGVWKEYLRPLLELGLVVGGAATQHLVAAIVYDFFIPSKRAAGEPQTIVGYVRWVKVIRPLACTGGINHRGNV